MGYSDKVFLYVIISGSFRLPCCCSDSFEDRLNPVKHSQKMAHAEAEAHINCEFVVKRPNGDLSKKYANYVERKYCRKF
jgi:hypothetical protein